MTVLKTTKLKLTEKSLSLLSMSRTPKMDHKHNNISGIYTPKKCLFNVCEVKQIYSFYKKFKNIK